MENVEDKLQDRVMLLEENSAHQSHTIDELSAQIAAQWTMIDQMRTKLDGLMEQLQSMDGAALDAPGNAPPPHY